MGERQYNILFILTDQLRADNLGCYGNQVIRTPNIDRIAQSAVRFDRAYVQNPVCMPSRASIFSGLSPRAHGVWTNGVPFDPQIETLPGYLARSGYTTASIGKIHLNPAGPCRPPYHWESHAYWKNHADMHAWHGPYLGFQHVELVIGHVDPLEGHYKQYLRETFPEGLELSQERNALDPLSGTATAWKNAMPAEYHYNSWITARCVHYLREHSQHPFFLVASFPDPHFPFSAPAPYCDIYDSQRVPSPLVAPDEVQTRPRHFEQMIRLYATGQTEENFRRMAAQTYGMVHFVDECVGKIMSELDRLGLRERTIVVFTADHGELLGDHGLIYKGPYLYQPLVKTPLIVSVPRLTQSPATSDALVGHVDLFPSLLEILGEERPESLQGYSFLPLLSGERQSTRQTVLTEFHDDYRQHGIEPIFNLKCIHHDRWKLVHYCYRTCGELYDLREDPDESHNLYDDPAYRGTVRDLEAVLLDEILRTEGQWPRRITPA